MPRKYTKAELETLLNTFLGTSAEWSKMNYNDLYALATYFDDRETLIKRIVSSLDIEQRRNLLIELTKEHGESALINNAKKAIEAWEENRPLKKIADKLFGTGE